MSEFQLFMSQANYDLQKHDFLVITRPLLLMHRNFGNQKYFPFQVKLFLKLT